MKLKRYQVENFRSVENSGWIDCDDVTTLVGINESGKSNLLLALWKLNPAREGSIDILHDMPVSKLSSLRKQPKEVKFVTADFMVDKESERLAEIEKIKLPADSIVTISRYYDGHYSFEFSIQPAPISGDIDQESSEDNDYQKKLNEFILSILPKFVYYSNYGNLSSKIYLPNVIKWLKGEQVTGIDINEDQVRTLRVLFDFVNLDPEEILELGKDPKELAIKKNSNVNAMPTSEQILEAEKCKEERSILLQSASGDLTKKFKDWWKQGEYKFRFEADGDYFRIWVSDKIRTEEVGLELRSTGLQWFISFYLIFLVESQEEYKNAILLLDEAGLTLHPLAQKDLSRFFINLSATNQIINTTHSPFIVDSANIDRCRVVYIDDKGFTVVSSNLRQCADSINEKSIYAVHAALGLSVSDILFQGCQCVIVEGPSDQYYFNAIKSFLIKEKLIAPKQEIVFVPSGGVKGISGVVSIIAGKGELLPFVIVDSDKSGQDTVKKLKSGLYKEHPDRIIEIKCITQMENSEVEDLIPIILFQRGINKLFHNIEDIDFLDSYHPEEPIIPQLEKFSQENGTILQEGWKVDLSRSVKSLLQNKKREGIGEIYITNWLKLFENIDK